MSIVEDWIFLAKGVILKNFVEGYAFDYIEKSKVAGIESHLGVAHRMEQKIS